MEKIKFFFEYEINTPFYSKDNFCFIKINNLLQNKYLIKEIEELECMYQQTYNDNYPPEPLHNDKIREYIFINRVLVSAELLQKELEGKYNFEFDWEEWVDKLKRIKEEIF